MAAPDQVSLTTAGVARRYLVDRVGAVDYVDGPDGSSTLVEEERFPLRSDQVAEGSALAPMPGGVVRVAVAVGDTVESGQLLVVLEAMKMEHTVHATSSGTVTEVDVVEGDQVETGRILVVVDSSDTISNGSPGTSSHPDDGPGVGSGDAEGTRDRTPPHRQLLGLLRRPALGGPGDGGGRAHRRPHR